MAVDFPVCAFATYSDRALEQIEAAMNEAPKVKMLGEPGNGKSDIAARIAMIFANPPVFNNLKFDGPEFKMKTDGKSIFYMNIPEPTPDMKIKLALYDELHRSQFPKEIK